LTPFRAFSAAVCGCFLLAAPLHAATSPDIVVVTAARLPQPLAQVPLDLRVIDRDAIERAGVSGLAELLQRHAGVEISATGGAGQPSGVFLRGSNANHVVLLVDGVRVNSATSGTNALEHLPLAQIERIEVLLGPASGLYGADAIGGVIQVFTRAGQGVRAEAGLGSDRTRMLSAGIGARSGGTRWSLDAGWRETHSPSATNPDNLYAYNADADPHRNANLGGSVSHEWATGHQLSLRGLVSDSRTHFDAGPDTDDLNDQRLSTMALESRDRVSETWTSLLRAARGSDRLESAGAYPSRFATDQDQITWQNDLRLGAGQATAGAEWRRERVSSDTAFTQTARSLRSGFGGYAVDLGRTQAQFALRHDRSSQFGGRTTGNAGWQYGLAAGWTVSAAAGTAFKAPSFNDLYYPLQWGYAGNPDLRPERSRSVEFGTRYAQAGWSLGATVFDNRIRDLIAINDSFTTVENVARADIRGLVLQARWSAGPWAARAEATFQSPENADTGAQLVRRARRHGSAGLDWAAGAWRAGAEIVASGARFDDAANSDAARLGGYTLLNLTAAWVLRPGWTLGARLDNAADKVYTLVRGYNPSPRQFLLTLAYEGS
jgi:vitamin B12 transporter